MRVQARKRVRCGLVDPGACRVVEPDWSDHPRLCWFVVGKTKNGHSVALGVRYGDVNLIRGGGLNILSDENLPPSHTAARTVSGRRRLPEAAS